MPLKPALDVLTEREQWNLKGTEIAKIGAIPKTVFKSVEIEVVSMEPMEGGIVLFVRAWDSKGLPIGFGADGSVEIERIRRFNPPIYVEDGTKTIISADFRGFTKEIVGLREDFVGALLKDLAHTISIIGKSGEKIVRGKIGNTTTTLNPDNSNEDSQPGRVSVNETFTTIRTSTGTRTVDLGGPNNVILEMSATTNQYDYMERLIFQFDGSAIPDADTISSATLSFYTSATGGHLIGGNASIDKVDASQISATTPDLSDYNYAKWSAVSQSSSTISIATLHGSAGYKDFTLNATGIGNISKTGRFAFGFRFEADLTNTEPTWVSGNYDYFQAYQHEDADTAKYPKIVIVHSSGGATPLTKAPYHQLLMLGVG